MNHPSCGCQEGYYEVPNQLNCIKCQYPCKKCSGDPLNCTECFSPNRTDAPTCSCKFNFYEKNQECLTCEFRCNGCQDSKENCLECKPGYHRTLVKPSCGCDNGFYEIANSADCGTTCGYRCSTC